MADTIAVMNAGRIEQMGDPVELYEIAAHDVRRELPRPVQHGRVHRDGHVRGPTSSLDMHGPAAIALPRSAVTSTRTDPARHPARRSCTWSPAGRAAGGELDVIKGGVITDASFIGVSTQYLVRMPWGQELVAFEQNRGLDPGPRPGHQGRARLEPRPRVRARRRPGRAAPAWRRVRGGAVAARLVSAFAARHRAEAAAARRGQARRPARRRTCCSCPGCSGSACSSSSR